MTTPDEADDVLEQLSADDDAFVHDLLSSLPPVPMPPDVLARLTAALAAEAGNGSSTPSGTPSGLPSGTVVPLDQARSRRFGPRLLSAAAVLLVLAGGYVVVKGQSTSGSGSSGSTTAGAQASTYAVEQTGTQYRTDALESQVHTLVSHQSPAPAGEGTSLGATPTFGSADAVTPTPTATDSSATRGPSSPVVAPLSSLVTNRTSLQSCLAAVAPGVQPGAQPVAVDAGTFDGQAALIIVFPGDSANMLAVFIVSPACNAKDAHQLAYHLVKRS